MITRENPKKGDVFKSFYGAYITILTIDYYHKAVIYLDDNNRTQVMKLDDFMDIATATPKNGITESVPMFTKCKEISL